MTTNFTNGFIPAVLSYNYQEFKRSGPGQPLAMGSFVRSGMEVVFQEMERTSPSATMIVSISQ